MKAYSNFAQIKSDLKYIILNYFINYIPFWPLRKVLYSAFGMKIGKGSRILMRTIVQEPQNIIIGRNTYINEYCYLDGRGSITIGDNVTIAVFSRLITGFHDIDDSSFTYKNDQIIVNNCVAIFTNCTVVAGTSIGEGCVFSANSMIKRGEYLPYGVYGGNPAKLIRQRTIDSEYTQPTWKTVFR